MKGKSFLILLLLVLSYSIVSAEPVCIEEFTFTTMDAGINKERVILLYIPKPEIYGEDIEIFPTWLLISHPDSIEEMERIFYKFFPSGMIEKNMSFIQTCYSGMGEEEPDPFPAKKIKISIYADESKIISNVPDSLTFDYFTLSGKTGKITFISNSCKNLPSPPQIIEINDSNNVIHLSWNAIHHPSGIKGYNVYKKSASGKFEKTGSLLRNTSYKEKLIAGGEFCYSISAVLNDGRETELSESKCITHIMESEDIKTYPNPASENVTFTNLPDNTELSIFTITGEKVLSVRLSNEHKYTWYLQNEAGNKVASGVYIYSAVSGDFKKKDKIVIVK